MPKISVIMPAYNAEKYIGEAIESILNQSYKDFEFIILNDCSNDTTESIISSYDDKRIVYVKNEENMGVARTLNKGLALAKGEYIARMDADDISKPERFEKQVAYMEENPAVAVLGSAVKTFGAVCREVVYSQTWEKLKVDLLFGSCLAHPSVMMRRSVIAALGGYDPWFEGMEDYELWCRVSQKHALATLPDVLLRYRVHPNQVTQKKMSEERGSRFQQLQAVLYAQSGVPTDGEGFAALTRIASGEPEVLVACTAYFQRIMDINRTTGQYDQRYLAASAEGAILRYVDKMPLRQAIQTAVRCGVSPVRYGLRRLRRWLRRCRK